MPKENVHAIALLNARTDKTEELNSLLTSLLEPTRQESGCIRFELL
jgi:quinol monooxygenase YgiN